MYLQDYIGKYIQKEKEYGYQSTCLVDDYVKRLTRNKYETKLHARATMYEDLPKSWKIIRCRGSFEMDDYREGDIFVDKDASDFGFNGIILSNQDPYKVTVITQNRTGKGTNPVEKHTYDKHNITYIVRPSQEDYIRNFKNSCKKENVTITKQEYNKLVDAYNKLKEVLDK